MSVNSLLLKQCAPPTFPHLKYFYKLISIEKQIPTSTIQRKHSSSKRRPVPNARNATCDYTHTGVVTCETFPQLQYFIRITPHAMGSSRVEPWKHMEVEVLGLWSLCSSLF